MANKPKSIAALIQRLLPEMEAPIENSPRVGDAITKYKQYLNSLSGRDRTTLEDWKDGSSDAINWNLFRGEGEDLPPVRTLDRIFRDAPSNPNLSGVPLYRGFGNWPEPGEYRGYMSTSPLKDVANEFGTKTLRILPTDRVRKLDFRDLRLRNDHWDINEEPEVLLPRGGVMTPHPDDPDTWIYDYLKKYAHGGFVL